MLSLSFITAFALFHLTVAQQTSLGIEAIEAHFTQSEIVPDLLTSFNPSALLSVNFPGVGDVQPGQSLTEDQVAPVPTVSVTPANSTVSLNGTYTLAMVDADIVGSNLTAGETRHWLVNGVTINGTTVSNETAVGITDYAGPAPATGSGPHRYVVLLYSQPSTFSAPSAFSHPNMGVSVFDFNGYVKDSGLGPLVAASYFTVEEGTATVTVTPTSAVVSSTLLVASSQATTVSGSVPASSASPSSTTKNGALTLKASGVSAVCIAAAGFILNAML